MSIIQSIKDTLNNLVDKYSGKNTLPEKDIGIRFIPAPTNMAANVRELQRYNKLTGETIPSENKVYITVWSPEAVERLKEAHRQLSAERNYSRK
jgi:hypothetical protein